MTSTAPLLSSGGPVPWVDRWRARVNAVPARRRLWSWLAPTLVTVLAFVLRIWNLGHPHELVFDETYYVKDSWAQWLIGFPAQWPDDADALFAAGDTETFDAASASYVVHPPLGRLLIGAGMALFGPDSSTGWRVTVMLAGTATVLALYLLAKAMTGSIAFASLAAFFVAIDGTAIVLSRVALLDGILTLFVVLSLWFMVLDRQWHLRRLADAVLARRGDGGATAFGPVLWNRPWLLAAGATAGAATAVKWSGLYVLAAIGIYAVITDALARRRAGIGFWPTDAAFRQGPASFLLLVPVAAVIYLASWSSWLLTDGGWGRHSITAENAATGFWSWVPLSLQNLWKYHESIYNFHVGLTTPHGYASPAWQWPLLLRPTSIYWNQDDAGANGCTLPAGCTEAISAISNPLLWWAGCAAAIALLVLFVLRRDWRYAVVLTALAATYLPWLMYPERTIFQFYTVIMVPFLALALTFALREIVGGRSAPPHRRLAGMRVVAVFVAVATLVSAFWYPVWTGMPVTYEYWRLHNWMRSWI